MTIEEILREELVKRRVEKINSLLLENFAVIASAPPLLRVIRGGGKGSNREMFVIRGDFDLPTIVSVNMRGRGRGKGKQRDDLWYGN